MHMRRFDKLISRIAVVACLVSVCTAASAQSDYDDIYYNPKTVKPAPKKKAAAAPKVTIADFPAAGDYTVISGSSTRDLDEYNRRGIFAPVTVADTVPADSLAADPWTYTRMIERFDNPDVVLVQRDDDLTALYYDSDDTDINIYFNGYPAYGYNPYWGYGTYPYGYNWGWYNPYWAYGPSWGWGYRPYWSWGYGPGWGWGWGPDYAWGWGGGPGWGWTWPGHTHWAPSHPSRPASAWASRRYDGGAYRNASSGRTPAYRGTTGTTGRPAANSRPASSGSNWSVSRVPSAGAQRAGADYVGNGTRPGTTATPGGSYRSGATNSRTTPATRNTGTSRQTTTRSGSSSSSSSGSSRSYNSNSGSSSRSSGGSYRSSGGGSSRSTGGGSSRGGGGRR